MKLLLFILLTILSPIACADTVQAATDNTVEFTSMTSGPSFEVPVTRAQDTPDSVFIMRLQQLPYIVELPC